MKYRNTSIPGNGALYLIKGDLENKNFEKNLEIISNHSPLIASNIEGYSSTYGENSKNQAYTIVNKDSELVGGVVIVSPLFADEALILKIFINEAQQENQKELYRVINQLVDFLARCNYEREYINIILENNIDLDKFNWHYQKCEGDNNFIYTNEYYPNISKTIEEIAETKEALSKEEIEITTATPSFDGTKKFISPIDSQTISEYTNNEVPLSSSFDRADSYLLNYISPDESASSINFNFNGEVNFKNELSWDKQNYTGRYSLIHNSLQICDYSQNKKTLTVTSDEEKTRIAKDNFDICYDKINKTKKITFKTAPENNKSLSAYVVLKDDKVQKCNIDLRIHKNSNNKIIGSFMLRWLPNIGQISLIYKSRKGEQVADITDYLDLDKLDFSSLSANPDSIDTVLNQLTTLIESTNCPTIKSQIEDFENETIDFLKNAEETIYSENILNSLDTVISTVKNDRKDKKTNTLKYSK